MSSRRESRIGSLAALPIWDRLAGRTNGRRREARVSMARWVAFVLFVLTGLVAAYCLANYWFVTNLWRTPLMLLEAPSPTGFGRAIFARESAFVALCNDHR